MSEELKAKGRRLIEEVFNKGDLELLGDFFAENVVVRRPPFPDVAGLAAVREARANIHRAFPDEHFTIDNLIAEGNVTALWCTMTGTHEGQGTSIPIPPTGKQIKTCGCMINRWVDGRIVEQWELFDYLGMLRQLGAIPPLGQGGR